MKCPKCYGTGHTHPMAAMLATGACCYTCRGDECNLCLGKGSLTDAQLSKRGYILTQDKLQEMDFTLDSINKTLEALVDKRIDDIISK